MPIAREIPFRPLDPEAEVWDVGQVARFLGLTPAQVKRLAGERANGRRVAPALPVIRIPIPGAPPEFRFRASVVRAFRNACERGALGPLLDKFKK